MEAKLTSGGGQTFTTRGQRPSWWSKTERTVLSVAVLLVQSFKKQQLLISASQSHRHHGNTSSQVTTCVKPRVRLMFTVPDFDFDIILGRSWMLLANETYFS